LLNDVLRGSLVAFVVWALSLLCLYLRLVPTYYFAAILAGWMLYALYRVFAHFARRSAATSGDNPRREALGYWLGAVGSSVLAALLWMLVVTQIKVF